MLIGERSSEMAFSERDSFRRKVVSSYSRQEAAEAVLHERVSGA
jgi:hypothetical protein